MLEVQRYNRHCEDLPSVSLMVKGKGAEDHPPCV